MEAIGHLTGGIAHDFNNLLAIAVGNLELLQERLVDRNDLQDLAQRALTALDRGSTLVQRLLAFARQQPLRIQPVDLNGLVAGIIELLRRTLGESIRVRMVLSPDLWLTLADPAQLENALVNLALNARDAMPRGGDLTIETANAWLDEADVAEDQEARPGPYSLLAVRDNGTGMAPSVVQKVFEPFFTTKGVGRGSGLGLSMVYGVVKQSGGQIKIDSVSGRGTTVRVYLPRTVPVTEGNRGRR
jgi:signal transduction histidine kinase